MIHPYPIHPKSLFRCRWLIFTAVLPISVYMILIQGPVANLSAVEIPMSLLIGPTLSIPQPIAEDPNRTHEAAVRNTGADAFPGQIPGANINPFEMAREFTEFHYDLYFSETIIADDFSRIGDAFGIWQPEPMDPVETAPVETLEPSPGSGSETTETPTAKPGPENAFISIIMKAAHAHDIDPAIIKAIIKAESGYNPKAVSKAGARGLMQLMPRTAESLGVEDSFCPEQNILAGVKYFKQLLTQFKGDIKLALAAYNAGSRKVREYKGIPPFKTTRIYIKKVFEYHEEYKREVVESG